MAEPNQEVQETLAGQGGRRKRPRVAEENRQRASRAYDDSNHCLIYIPGIVS